MTYILFFHRLFDRKVTWSNPHSAGEELNLNYQGKSYNKHISNKCFREIPRSCLTVLFFIKIFIKRSILCSKYCCGIMVVVFFVLLCSCPHIQAITIRMHIFPLSLSHLLYPPSIPFFPSLLSFFSFLIFWHYKMLQACIIFLCLIDLSTHFSKEPQFLSLGQHSETRFWVLFKEIKF